MCELSVGCALRFGVGALGMRARCSTLEVRSSVERAMTASQNEVLIWNQRGVVTRRVNRAELESVQEWGSVRRGAVVQGLVLVLATACGASHAPPPPAPTPVVWSQGSSEPGSAGKTETERSTPAHEPAAAEPASEKASSAKAEPAPPPAAAESAAPESKSGPVPVLQPLRRPKATPQATAAEDAPAAPEPAAPAPAAAEAATYDGPDACHTAHFSVPAVQEACASKGRAGAKSVMKQAIANARAAGNKLGCSDCHRDQHTYRLKTDAVARLRRWLD